MVKTADKALVLSGRTFQKKDLIIIQETVELVQGLSFSEIALTIAEIFSWRSPSGKLKVESARTAIEKMEKLGLIKLPLKKVSKKRVESKITWSSETDYRDDITVTIEQLGPVSMILADDKVSRDLWNEYVDRYHYLKYKRPVGSHLRYFITAIINQKVVILGCMLFSASALSLASRDKWIEWTQKDKNERLFLIINNSRFLILPWVKIKNLATKSLSIIEKQIQTDWQKIYNYKPVLIETFVDSSKYQGTSYKAANWTLVGETAGRGRNDSNNEQNRSVKYVFLKPLDPNFRFVLKGEKVPAKKNNYIKDDKFATVWHEIVHIISEVSNDFDNIWQRRSRVINSMLLILLIFRLVFSKNKQGYNTTIAELWDNCKNLNIPLPQDKPIAASSFSTARKKLDESIFKKLNEKIIDIYGDNNGQYDWLGHRIFAVDGRKVSVPRELLNEGFKMPSKVAHYPHGLLSCLYQLKSKIPYAFDFTPETNERALALDHLKMLKENDVIVYDRGYFSYQMLFRHNDLKLHPIFRLPLNSFKEIQAFIDSDQTDSVVTIYPHGDTKRNIIKKYPSIEIIPLKLRLVKYVINGTTYYLGTTLFDKQKYSIETLSNAYHTRWGIEELYKVSKNFVEVTDFHSKTVRGIKQELFAHFTLITMNRIFANQATNNLEKIIGTANKDLESDTTSSSVQVNFKNCLATFSRRMEEIILFPAIQLNNAIKEVLQLISSSYQKTRENRSYQRISKVARNKWRGAKLKTCSSTI